MQLSTTATRTLTVPAPVETTWALIADVPDSVAHFAGLESFLPDGPDTWRWTLKRLGAGKLSLQTVYTCVYATDPAARVVTWSAARAPADNAAVEGSWTLTAAGSGSRLVLVNQLTLDMDLPRVMRRPAQALVTRENAALIDRYLANLRVTLSGGDGRVR